MKIVPFFLEIEEIPIEYVGLFVLIVLWIIIAITIDGHRD